MLAEAVLSPVQLPMGQKPAKMTAAMVEAAGRPALRWELDHLTKGIAALRDEEATVRYVCFFRVS